MPPARANVTAQAREHLMEVLAPVVAETGYDLEDVTVTSAGRRSLVRVIVDADGGVDLVCRLLLEKKNDARGPRAARRPAVGRQGHPNRNSSRGLQLVVDVVQPLALCLFARSV